MDKSTLNYVFFFQEKLVMEPLVKHWHTKYLLSLYEEIILTKNHS